MRFHVVIVNLVNPLGIKSVQYCFDRKTINR